MRNFIPVALLIPLLTAIISCSNKTSSDIIKLSPLSVSSGQLQRIDIFSPEMNETIKIDVWTPNGYNPERSYQVIYMHDGQNLFDASSTWNKQAWEIDSIAGDLIDKGSIPPAIIVGIHSVDTTRLGDLMPERPLKYLQNDTIKHIISLMCRDNYRADEYLSFIVNTLRPIINCNFSADTTLSATSIMGSSMGGLISIYGMCEYPEIFGSAACLSTHWTGAIGGNEDFPMAMRKYLLKKLPRDNNHHIYLDNGDCPYDSVYIPYFNSMIALVDSIGYNDNRLLHGLHHGHSHSEQSWASRVDIPLKFLLNNDK